VGDWRPRILGLAVFAMGVSAFVTQVTLMREMLGALSGNELVLGIVLGSWMLLTGLGAWVGRAASRFSQPFDVLIAGQLLIAALPIVGVFLLRVLWNHIFVRGSAVGVSESVVVSLVLLAPYCLVTGVLLTVVCHILGQSDGSAGIGRVYLFDSVGGIVGGIAMSFVLVWWFNSFGLLYWAAAVNLLAAVATAWAFRRKVMGGLSCGGAAGLAVLVAGCDLDDISTRWQYPGEQVEYRGHSPYGRLVVTRSGSQYNFIENGVVLFSTRDAEGVEETVHYAMAQRPDSGRVLLLSGGVSGTAREILKYPIEAVDYVELDPLVLDVARRLLPDSLADPRIHVIQTDGRRFVRQATEKYDVAIVDVPEPSTFQLNRFYTREFLAQIAARLRPGGVLSFSLGRYEDYVSREQSRLISTMVHTLRREFAEVLMLPGGRLFFLASDGPLTSDVAGQLESSGIATRLVNRHYLRGTLTADRLADLRRAVADNAPLNEDFNPVLYYYRLLHWMNQFQVRFGLLEATLLVILGVYLVRIRAVPLVVFAGGFTASAMEVVLLMGYQILYGSTYQQMSVIVTMFMIGLGAGAWLMNRGIGRRTGKDLAWLQGLIGAMALAIPVVLLGLGYLDRHWPGLGWVGQVVIPLATLGLATAVGMEFPLAAKVDFRSASATAAGLYTADYVGAALGALLVSTLLIPVLGVVGVSVLTLGLSGVSIAVLLWR
jgi:spermidine synthase